MNIIFSDDFILGVTIGITLTCVIFYIWLQIKEHEYAKRARFWLQKWLPFLKQKAPPVTVVKGEPIHYTHNLDKEKIHLELKELLKLLHIYQGQPSTYLLQQLHEILHKHTPEGNNLLHEYIAHEESGREEAVETVKEILEIEPELLKEENAEGETALMMAEKNERFEIAEFLIEEHHFASHKERHDYLAHANHHGDTALHMLEHIWHLHHVADMWHLQFEHFLHMLEQHPVGSLLWKNHEGKAIYESLLHLEAEQRKQLLEMLIHRGVLQHHEGHLEMPAEVRHKIAEENEKHNNITALAQLYLNTYPHFIHHEETPPQSTTPTSEPKEGARSYKLEPPHPT